MERQLRVFWKKDNDERRVLVFPTNLRIRLPADQQKWSSSLKSKNLRFKCNFRFRKLWFLISFDHMDKKRTLSFDPIDPWRTFNYSLNYYLASFRYSKKGEIRKFQEKLAGWPIRRKISKISRKGMFICLQMEKKSEGQMPDCLLWI